MSCTARATAYVTWRDAPGRKNRWSRAESRLACFQRIIRGKRHVSRACCRSAATRWVLHPRPLSRPRRTPCGNIGQIVNADRLALEDVEMGGVAIPAGSTVLIAMAGADRDPERFRQADRFDIRRDFRGHIAFGHGLHYCLGAPPARLEGHIAIRGLLERCPDLRLDADGTELPWMWGLLIRGARELPLHWWPSAGRPLLVTGSNRTAVAGPRPPPVRTRWQF
ncbi:cytochrome P450, partial [Streptomyces sp. NPDC058656]